jgi:hypothetical protein
VAKLYEVKRHWSLIFIKQLGLKSNKFHLFLAQNITKMVEKIATLFLPIFIMQKYHKTLKNISRTHGNLFVIFAQNFDT